MDLRQLRYFIAVYEHGGVSRAAAEIPISQPALTRSVQLLEDELGVSLFQRGARGVIPTSAGEKLYRHAHKILAACDHAEEDVRGADEQLSGEITIGVSALFTHSIMERVIGDFYEKHPRIKITVCQELLGDLLVGLERNDYELVLCNFPIQALPDAHTPETLLILRSHIYVSAGHPLAKASDVSWKSVAEASWVSFNQSQSKEAINALFLNQNLAPPQTPVLTNSLALIKSMILERGFVGMLPRQVMEAETAAGKAVQISLPGTPIIREAGLITLKDTKRSPLAELLSEDLRLACRDLGAS
jgi:DNA-binding transcriptional LysR family regulator